MDSMVILEHLANCSIFNNKIAELIETLPDDIKNSFLNNDPESLKKKLSFNQEYLANELEVAQIRL